MKEQATQQPGIARDAQGYQQCRCGNRARVMRVGGRTSDPVCWYWPDCAPVRSGAQLGNHDPGDEDR